MAAAGASSAPCAIPRICASAWEWGLHALNSPERRDRLWLINAFAVVLLTLLGAAGEALGYDRMPETNTVKRRVHSVFRQGCIPPI